MSDKGKFVLILGPSGSGKGTVLKYLKDRHPEFVFPVSCTTRDPRPHEIEGEVYNFICEDEFRDRIEAGEFLEYAYVHDMHYYGTLKKPIMDALDAGKIVIREVDVQGVRSIRELLPVDQVMTVFLRANWDDLEKRIKGRAPISDEELAERHESFMNEMKWQDESDHVIESIEGEIEQQCKVVEQVILDNLWSIVY